MRTTHLDDEKNCAQLAAMWGGNKGMLKYINELELNRQQLEAQRDAAVEALRALVDCPDYRGISTHEMKQARDVIAAAEKGAQP